MKRNLLAAAAATAPLLAASIPALAQTTISSSTSTPVQTATANNGAPSDVIVSGSIGLTAPGTALTLNSNNNASVTGELGATGQNNTTGLSILGGFTGSATNTGTIDITETYSPPADPSNDGLFTGVFAQGSGRIGLEVVEPTAGSTLAFTGNNATVSTASGNILVNGITNVGTIEVVGNNVTTPDTLGPLAPTYGVYIAAPVNGSYMSLAVIPSASSTTAPTILTGTITALGQGAIGFYLAPTGSIVGAGPSQPVGSFTTAPVLSGDVRLSSVNATGPGAQAVVLDGNVGGFVNISGTVESTGYRTTTRQTNPFVAELYSMEEMQQNGAAVTLGGNIGGGLIVSAPPPLAGTSAAYTNAPYADLDNDGIPDALQGTGSVTSLGSAPAMQVGSAQGNPITIGLYNASDYLSIYNGQTQLNGGAALAKFGQFGLVIQGSVTGQSLFDQLTSPYLLNPLPATALQIGGQILTSPVLYSFGTNYLLTSTTPLQQNQYATSGPVTIQGGIYNSGTIAAYAFQADATAIHLGAGASTPTIYNDGQIFASSTQVNSATTVPIYNTGYPSAPKNLTNVPVVAVNVVAIQIDPGASLTTIDNNSGILAELTGSSGVGGFTGAIIDKSGTLQNINNTGSITALLNQTDVTELMPTTSAAGTSNTVAIDMSAGTLPQTITQSAVVLQSSATGTVTAYNPATSTAYTPGEVVTYLGNYYVNVVEAGAGIDPIDDPTFWREIGAVTPSITGNIYMGSGNDTLNINAGTVSSNLVSMGGGLNTINVGSSSTSGGATTLTQADFIGFVTQTGAGAFNFNVVDGLLSDLNPKLNQTAQSITVGSSGVLAVTADPAGALNTASPGQSENTQFHITGSANLAAGAQIGLTLASLQTASSQIYTIMYGAPGTISAPALGQTSLGNAPFLYSATAAFVPSATAVTAPGVTAGDNAVTLTVGLKTAAQLGFNPEEAAAYLPILTTLQTTTVANQGIQQALLGQSTEAGLKSVYDQLLPNQGQGIFEALDAAAEKISGFTDTPPDNATHVGGTSLWLQEVNEDVERSGVDSLGSTAQVLGLAGGYERMGIGGGALGVTLAYFNAQENDSASQLGAHDVGSLVEGSVYYRRSIGNLTLGARVGGGYGWFSETRVFTSGTTIEQAQGSWTGDFVDGHIGAAYEVKIAGPYYVRPELSLDYLRLAQNGYQEAGPNSAFNLAVGPQTDSQLSGQGLMVFGRQWGRAAWFRTELNLGYREVIDGSVGDTTANFEDGTPFTLAGDPDKGGWAVVGFSLKSGSEFSYLALQGEADFRKGQQRYDLRVAGRSVF